MGGQHWLDGPAGGARRRRGRRRLAAPLQPLTPPSTLHALQVIQLAAIGFVTGGAAALTPGVCTLLREGLEREATDPARLAQATAAVELLVRTGQSLEPMVSIARTFKAERDTARQQAHAYYNQSQAAQQQVAVAKSELEASHAAWARERKELEAQAQKVKRLEGVTAQFGRVSQ